MKKLLLVLGVVVIGFAFTSCKKECKCKTIMGISVSFGDLIDNKSDCLALKDDGVKCEWK